MPQKPRVALFVTCLVDLFRPSVGFAAVELLEAAGCVVEVPQQTCCGQPAFNSGDFPTTRDLARQAIEKFAGYDYVVGPSGSCIATIRHDYPKLFEGDAEWLAKAEALARRSHELFSFLTDIVGAAGAAATPSAASTASSTPSPARNPVRFSATATYHDGCSGLRALGIKAQPRALLAEVDGLVLAEMRDTEVCCGFGGTFCVKYPEISAKMVDDKVADMAAAGADTLLGGDLGCLLHIAGRLKRLGKPVRVFHAAEVLSGYARTGIGDPES